jgi:hypothetical protein
MNTTTTTPIKPADLDIYTLHSPEAVKAWKQDVADYHQALARIERAKEAKQQAAIAEQNRVLTDEEYYQEALKRKKIADDIAAERAAAEKAAALAEIERLMSSPKTVDVINRNEVLFMIEVIQWANRGYTMAENGFHSFGMGLYHITMNAPAK